jgi:DNA-binding NarL/FixJ family response regulator
MPRASFDVAVIEPWLDRRYGIDLCARIVATLPAVPCIVLFSPRDDTTVFDAIASGASAFFPRQIRGAALVGAIRAVAGGGSLLGATPKRQLMRRVAELRRASSRRGPRRASGDAKSREGLPRDG